MFHSARIKLTAWYLIIIMSISVFFSVIIYRGVAGEIERGYRRVELHVQTNNDIIIPSPNGIYIVSEDVIDAAKQRVLLSLIYTNAAILVISSIAGYFLAGRTLKPIEEMLDEQNRFIADASHELRTPLTALKTSIEVNLRDKHIKLSQAKQLLEENLEEINSMQTLSDNLLQLAQFQKENNAPVLVPVSLAKILEKAYKNVLPMANEKQITISLPSVDVTVSGDEGSLAQLFVILLDNAVKYSDSNSQIQISVHQQKRFVTVRIQDQGIGIEKENLPHVFERFYRADESRSKVKANGYGLGLPIAKKITDSHKGKIEIESVPGKGTTVLVHLPIT